MNTITAAYAAAQQAIATAVRTAPTNAICTILTVRGPRSITKRDGVYVVTDDSTGETVETFGALSAAHTAVHATA